MKTFVSVIEVEHLRHLLFVKEVLKKGYPHLKIVGPFFDRDYNKIITVEQSESQRLRIFVDAYSINSLEYSLFFSFRENIEIFKHYEVADAVKYVQKNVYNETKI